MPSKVEEALAKAQGALGDLAKAVDVLPLEKADHLAEAREAHASGCKHDALCEAHMAEAASARAKSTAHMADGQMDKAADCTGEAGQHEEIAGKHAELADEYHDLAAQHMAAHHNGMSKADADQHDNPWMNFAKEMGGYHEKCMADMGKRAEGYEAAAGEHEKAMRKDDMEMCNKIAKGARDRITKRGKMHKDMMDMAAKIATPDQPVMSKADLILDEDGFDKETGGWFKREFSDKERQGLANTGAAMPDGSFPIENKQDLKNAIQAHGRSKNPEAAKQHIIQRAKTLDATDELPDGWQKLAKTDQPESVHVDPAAKPDGIKDGLPKQNDNGKGPVTENGKIASMKDLAEKPPSRNGVPELSKGLGIISRLASMLKGVTDLRDDAIAEQMEENDPKDPMIKGLMDWLKNGLDLLKTIVANESAEIMNGKDVELPDVDDAATIELMAKGVNWHDALAEALLDSVNDGMEPAQRAQRKLLARKVREWGTRFRKAENGRALQNAGADPEAMAKAADALEKVTAERDSATVSLDQALKGLEKVTDTMIPHIRQAQELRKVNGALRSEMSEVKERLLTIENQALPARGIAMVPSSLRKTADRSGKTGPTPGLSFEEVAAMPPGREKQNEILKLTYANR